ncbi:MAG: alanine acetyltransferase [Pseudoxanthomonas sp.]
MSELWSSQQHEWLTALGHTLYVPGSAEAPAAAVVVADKPVAQAPAFRAATPAAPPPLRRAPDSGHDAPTRTAETPRRATSRLPDKLHFALIRASGCNPAAEGAAQIMARWPSSAELRGNPAAKRALWPQLRALRRQQLP